MSNKKTTFNLPKGIYFSTKPVSYSHSSLKHILDDKYSNSHHASLIYSDGNGNYRVIRGGPVNYQGARNLISGGSSRIEAQIDIPLQQSYDKINIKEDINNRIFTKLDISDNNLMEEWKGFAKGAEIIEKK